MDQRIKELVFQSISDNGYCSLSECQESHGANLNSIRQSFISIYKHNYQSMELLCLITIRLDQLTVVRYAPYSQISQRKIEINSHHEVQWLHFDKQSIKQLIVISLYSKDISMGQCISHLSLSNCTKTRPYQNKFAVRQSVKSKEQKESLEHTQKKQKKININLQKVGQKRQNGLKGQKGQKQMNKLAKKQIISLPLKKMSQKQQRKETVLTGYHLQQDKLYKKPQKMGMNKMQIEQFNNLFDIETSSETESESVRQLFNKMANQQVKRPKNNRLQTIKEKQMVQYKDSDQQDDALFRKMQALSKPQDNALKNTLKTRSSPNKNSKIIQKPKVKVQEKSSNILNKWLKHNK